MNNYKPKSTQFYNDSQINYQNFTWKDRELDQLYIQTYRHFTNKIRQIKSNKPNVQLFETNWFDLQFFKAQQPQAPDRRLRRILKKKKNESDQVNQSKQDKIQQLQWLSTQKIKSKNKKSLKKLNKDKPATASLEKKPIQKFRRTFYVKKTVSHSSSIPKTFDSQNLMGIILAANNVQLLSYPTSSFLYFNVYVQDGNNSEMIKNSIRKRSGWRVVESPNVANMIWSQFYKYSLDIRPQRRLRELLKNKQKSEMDNSSIIDEKLDTIVRTEPFRMKSQSSTKKKDESLLKYETYEKQVSKLCPFFEHLCIKKLKNIQIGPGLHIFNHFPNHYCISDKKSLLKNMETYYELENSNVFLDVPFSIQITWDTDLGSLQHQIENKSDLWIIKPGQNSNRGKGIVVCSNIDSVLLQVQSRFSKNQKEDTKDKGSNDKDNKNSKENKKNQSESKIAKILKKQTLLIQQYIQPLLYNKRKIDIRMFLLVTFVKGKIRGYLYDEGYLRTSSKIFSLQNFDKFIHLTNDAIQIESADYGKYEEGNKISWKKFQQWSNEKQYRDLWSNLQKQTKRISKNILSASRSQLVKKNFKRKIIRHQRALSNNISDKNKGIEQENLYYEIFGLDFLIGKKFNIWLIEVNTNPALNTDCSRVVRNLIPKMIDNAFDIAVEPFTRVNQNADINKYDNHFFAIYDDEWDSFYKK